MGIRSRLSLALACAALAGGSATKSHEVAFAAPGDPDNFIFMNDPSYDGIPDKDTHSGVFLDVINTSNQSLTSELNPIFVKVTFPAASPTKRIYVFDGNNAGLWDQGNVNVTFPMTPASPLYDSVTAYDVFTLGAAPSIPVWHGESEITHDPSLPPILPQVADVIFHNAVDGQWELFLDAATLPAPAQAAATDASGDQVYYVKIRYLQNVPTAINGFKVAANGDIELVPDPSVANSTTWLGGFIGGVVDAQRDDKVPTAEGQSYSFSRDHYPNILKPGTAGKQLPYGPGDTYDNTYAGVLDIPIHIVPPDGVSLADYVLNTLRIEDADFDDRFDATEPDANGNPVPHVPSPGQPADQGGYYVGDGGSGGNQFDSAGFAIPVSPVWPRPPNPVPAALLANPSLGAPYVEVYSPGHSPKKGDPPSFVIHDLSGNVGSTGTTGFERIPLAIAGLPAAERIPGNWLLRFRDVDARNSIFVRSNATYGHRCLQGRVYCDVNKNGNDDNNTDPGIAGVLVKVTRTDVSPVQVTTYTTLADGSWHVPHVLPGTYQVDVDATQSALAGKPSTTPVTFTKTIGDQDCVVDVDFGFDCATCQCKNGLMMKKVCYTADEWVGSAKGPFEVGVEFRQGCCDEAPKTCCAKKCDAPMLDRLVFPYAGGDLKDPVTGPNGVVEVHGVSIANGILTVQLCLDTDNAALFPKGWFEGRYFLKVFVTGFDFRAGCGCITCSSSVPGKRWPACPATDPNCWAPFGVVSTEVASCEPPPPPKDCGCTHTIGWWKTHSKYACNRSQRLAWPGPCSEDTLLCGRSWISILQTSPRGNPWFILAQQWIGASLNRCKGACVPGDAEAALVEARVLLTQNCSCLPKGTARDRALELADLLDNYNNGLLGVPHCGDEGGSTKTPPPTDCPAPPPPPKKTSCARHGGEK